MRDLRVLHGSNFLLSFVFVVAIGSSFSLASAASITLSWQDNSTNEDGFKIERGVSGSYAVIASVGANTRAYTDSGLLAATTYCYRVRSFNSSGTSSPSNDSCATIPTTTFSLSVTKSGTGSGSLSSGPAGINCGTDCSEAYVTGTVVSLIATPASGSTFAGWTGDSDCSDGIVTMGANKSCVATFNTTGTSLYTLSVTIASAVGSEGSGSGTVTSNPAGISCGSDCSQGYSSNTVVSLTAVPSSGSIFTGWSGDSDCLDGVLTMGGNKSCMANFKIDTATLTLVRHGNGTVTSTPSGINCGSSCSKSYAKGTKVTLSAAASADSRFAGWVGGGCQGLTSCTVSLLDSTSVSASFVALERSAIGIFRPATGEWFLDMNRNGVWDGCTIDLCWGSFGAKGDLPVAGDWTRTGLSNIGVYRPSTGEWLLDLNGNGQWDGCSVDRCLRSGSLQNSLPVVGDWTGSGVEMLGEVIPGRTSKWYLDRNGDGKTDGCSVDACLNFPIDEGDLPVAGDWDGIGTAKIGRFSPSTGNWFLDLNGDGKWKNCNFEKCVRSFGAVGDRPVVGNWTGIGAAKIGLYRPATGEWFLDLNGNGKWDDCGTDGCAQFIGRQQGDLPVVGLW
jgi:List-Bact-rpt repeat protein